MAKRKINQIYVPTQEEIIKAKVEELAQALRRLILTPPAERRLNIGLAAVAANLLYQEAKGFAWKIGSPGLNAKRDTITDLLSLLKWMDLNPFETCSSVYGPLWTEEDITGWSQLLIDVHAWLNAWHYEIGWEKGVNV